MKVISGKRMCNILQLKGWSQVRVTGSHHIFVRSGSTMRVTVPVHGHQDLKLGLQRAIMKLAEIADSEL